MKVSPIDDYIYIGPTMRRSVPANDRDLAEPYKKECLDRGELHGLDRVLIWQYHRDERTVWVGKMGFDGRVWQDAPLWRVDRLDLIPALCRLPAPMDGN